MPCHFWATASFCTLLQNATNTNKFALMPHPSLNDHLRRCLSSKGHDGHGRRNGLLLSCSICEVGGKFTMLPELDVCTGLSSYLLQHRSSCDGCGRLQRQWHVPGAHGWPGKHQVDAGLNTPMQDCQPEGEWCGRRGFLQEALHPDVKPAPGCMPTSSSTAPIRSPPRTDFISAARASSFEACRRKDAKRVAA